MTRTIGSSLFLSLVVAFQLAASPLRTGDGGLTFVRHDGSGLVLVPADNPILRFEELDGKADAVVRLTPDGGISQLIVVGPSEIRAVRLRQVFDPAALHGTQLRVEVLQGEGRVQVTTSDSNGRMLQPRADAAGGRRRVVGRTGPSRPPSFTLIDDAEKAGTINSETALLYRVYSSFADSRLPEQYRGDDGGVADSLYMSEVRDRFTTVSESAQSAVAPFLTPPSYRGSWANSTRGEGVSTLATPPPCEFFSDEWASIDSSNGLVRVWYRADLPDAQRAAALVGRIDSTLWSKIAGLMTKLPLSDLGVGCNGGNGRLDIYLVDAPSSHTIAYKECDRAPRAAFILLKRTVPDALAVHEIFHAFQFAYPLAGCITDDNYRWWAESSAQWSQDFVIPADKTEQFPAPVFLNVPEVPLDEKGVDHEYGAYLLPFYVYRKSGSANFVRAAWENSSSQPALEALDQALPGGFDAVWPEFAKYNWNREPFDDYTKWDGLTAKARPAGGAEVTVSVAPDFALNLALGLPRLSATYKHFKFDDSARTIAFWNGVTTNLVLRDRPLGGRQYENDSASSDQTKGAHITALIKLAGQWKTEDWTNLSYMTYCRDLTAERIEELVLIISNSEFRSRDRKLEAPGLRPVLWATNMGCWKWKGTAQYSDEVGVTIDTNVTWTRVEASQSTPTISYKAEGMTTWGVANEACAGHASTTLDGFALLTTFNYITADGTFNRGYTVAGSEGKIISLTCGLITIPWTFGTWLSTPLPPFMPGMPGARLLTVSGDGTVMDDKHFLIPGNPSGWTWHFKSERQ